MKTKLNLKQSFTAGISAAVVAAVLNAILFYAFHGMGVITDTIFIQPNQPMTIVPVVISSIVPTLIASLVFFLIEKYTQNGYSIFRVVALVLMVVSFANPFLGIQGIPVGYAVVLNLMHVVVVVALLYFLRKKITA